MVGMFSLLGVLFGMPLADILQPLTIGEAAQQALLEHDGELGQLLALVEAAENGDHAALNDHLQNLQIDAESFNQIIADANLWMQEVASGKSGNAHA
jgi:EAL and modified HD-GYP domain-containing signal transduction protein